MQNSLVKWIRLTVLSSFALVGCTQSIKPEQKIPATLTGLAYQEASFVPVFSTNLPSNITPIMTELQVATQGNLMITASNTGILEGLVADNKIWSHNVGEPIVGGVGYDEITHVAVVSTRSGKVIAINGETGEQYWQKSLGATVPAPALIMGNRVLVTANDGVIYGLNLQSGVVVWQFATQSPLIKSNFAPQAVLIDQTTAIFGVANGRVYAINTDTGELVWSRRVGKNGTGRLYDIDGKPLIVNNRLYVASIDGQLLAFDMATGQQLFAQDFASNQGLVYAWGNLLGVDNEGIVRAFNATTGQSLWQNSALMHRKPSNMITIGRFVAVGDYEGVVHLLNAQGDIVARTQTHGRILNLTAQGHYLYAQTQTGTVAVWQVQ